MANNIQFMNNGGIRLQVTNNIPSFLNRLRINQDTALTNMGKFGVSKMKIYVAVKTGFLRSRCGYRITGPSNNKNLVLFNDCYYAGYQEMGTYKMAAHPFMRPAIYNHISELKQLAGRYLGNGLG